MVVPTNFGTPQLPFDTTGVENADISETETTMSDAPTPQFAPIARGCGSIPANTSSSAPGMMPIIVRPAVSNDMVHTYGTPTRIAASAAALASSGADIVSIHATSAPPAFKPSICSANASIASSSVSAPSGSKSSPVGPTEPATTTGLGDASATLRAICAAAFANSNVRSCALCSFNRWRLQPNELVRMMSDPASTNCWCNDSTRSGWSVIQNSGGSPEVSPMAK